MFTYSVFSFLVQCDFSQIHLCSMERVQIMTELNPGTEGEMHIFLLKHLFSLCGLEAFVPVLCTEDLEERVSGLSETKSPIQGGKGTLLNLLMF